MKQNITLKNLGIILSLSFLLALVLPQEVLAQKKKSKGKSASPAQSPPSRKPGAKSKIKPYSQVITKDAQSDAGLFTFHKVGDKYYFEIPDSLLEQEMLIVSRLSGTIDRLTFGGAGQKTRPQQVIRWQKKDNKILLRSVSYNSIASEELPIYKSVRNNNFEPIIKAFDIAALKPDSSGYVIEISSLFTTDVPMIGPLRDSQRKRFGVRSLDKSRSMIMGVKSYPQNIEVRHVLTYNATKMPSNALTNSLSLEMNQSMILLPADPMQPRYYDERVGYFSVQQTDYDDDYQRATPKRLITRWRLEPKDPEAFRRGELVEPVKPIVYYIDPSTPEKWRPYLKQGVEDWNVAFAEAGFKNAIIAKDPPSPEEDPEFSPEDIRYSVIRYTANNIQNAQGPHVHDPRTGEILESDIIWYHNVMNLLRNWFFVQTAAINPEARKVQFKDEIMGRLIRFVSAHEVGHTIGFPHNMGASASYPVDSLRSASFTQKMGTAPSIMDYARFNYVAQPEDKGVGLMPDIGVYDKYATKWGYRPILEANSPEEERATLNTWVREHENDPMYRYGRQMGNPLDPSSQTEDLGDNSVKASQYGIANLKRIMPKLIEWTKEDAKDFSDLAELYGQVINQWNRYMGHVATNIGGVYIWNKTYDQEGDVYTFVPKERQKEAMDFLIEQAFNTPTWMIREDVMDRVEPGGVIDRIRGYQERILRRVLDFSRLARMIEMETREPNRAYPCLDMLSDLRRGIWREAYTGRSVDTYRRSLQRAYIEQLEKLMTDEQPRLPRSIQAFSAYTPIDVSQSDIRPMARGELKQIQTLLRNARGRGNTMTRYHYDDILARIDMMLDPR